jgi:hypothetical protein
MENHFRSGRVIFIQSRGGNMQSVLFWLFFCIPLADYFTYKCNLWCVADPGKVLRCPAITPINPECEQTFKTILIFAVGLNITQQFYESTITNASQRASYFDSILFSCLEPSFNNLTPSAALVMAKATFRLHCF